MPHTGNVPQAEIRVGQRIGRGVVQRLGLRYGKRHLRAAELLCDCGTVYVRPLGYLRTGDVHSCGCLRREVSGKSPVMLARVHGLADHPLYPIWYKIIDRCENPRCGRYRDYGGRGIRVYRPWRDVRHFVRYVEDALGPRPSPRHSIDRIDNDGHYEPGNIRWTDPAGQYANTPEHRDPVNGRFVQVARTGASGHRDAVRH